MYHTSGVDSKAIAFLLRRHTSRCGKSEITKVYFFSPEPLTGLTNGGNDYGYSQWHYQEDDRFGWSAHFQDGQRSDRGFGKGDRDEERAYGWSAAAALTRVALLMAARVDLRLLLVADQIQAALSMSKE